LSHNEFCTGRSVRTRPKYTSDQPILSVLAELADMNVALKQSGSEITD
jgi:hypothetical protein